MMKKRNKWIGIFLLLGLIVAGIIGTYAYLTSITEPIDSTFTIGKVDIDLTEPNWDPDDRKIVPGGSLAKDPTITVKENSEDSYVFIKLTTSQKFIDLKLKYDLDMSNKWNLMTGITLLPTEEVYAYNAIVPTSTTATVLEPLFTTITFLPTLTSTEVNTLQGEKISVRGYAIQAEGFATNAEAWAELAK